MEAGFGTDGTSSALNFNGMSSPDLWKEKGFNTDKSRWRVVVDQGVDRDVLRIDQTLHPTHPDYEPPSKNASSYPFKTWAPITIDATGKIKLLGEVELCDKDGNNCRTL